MRKDRTFIKKAYPYLTSAPALTLIGLIVLFPILYTFYISFTNMNIYNWFTFNYIGFSNYQRAIFVIDSGFIKALIFTIVWTIVNMVLQLIIAFIIAFLLNNKLLKGKGIYKTILLIPWAIPGYVSILIWRTGMFNTEFGLLNQWLNAMGLESVNWLGSSGIAFISLVVVNLWLALPFMVMIMDGALQSIDQSYYEAADMESANIFHKILFITVPLIKPVIGPAVIITLFTTFKQFDIVFLLTLQPGSRTGANLHTIITYAYENAFITNNYGYSSAISIIIFILLIVFVILTNKRLKRGKDNV